MKETCIRIHIDTKDFKLSCESKMDVASISKETLRARLRDMVLVAVRQFEEGVELSKKQP